MDKQERFIEKAEKKFKNFFDYSLVKYIDPFTKVKIICPIHGIFEQSPTCHIQSVCGCPACGKVRSDLGQKTKTNEEFIKQAKEIHGNKYDYSLVDYKNSYTKVKIICPIHGIFEQKPYHHLNDKTGCPFCNESKGEKKIRVWLENNKYVLNETYFREYKFENCKDKNPLPFDFYLPMENLLIEFNGKQHYEDDSFKNHNLKIQKYHDWLKRKYACDNNIKLLTIPYWDYKIINNIMEEELGS